MQIEKERIELNDGRYLIYFTFPTKAQAAAAASEHPAPEEKPPVNDALGPEGMRV